MREEPILNISIQFKIDGVMTEVTFSDTDIDECRDYLDQLMEKIDEWYNKHSQ